MRGQGGGVARAVKHSDDYKFALVVHEIDGVIPGEADAKAGRELLARGSGKRKMAEWIAVAFDPLDDTVCRRLRRFGGDIKPDFGEVRFGRVG